MGEFKNRLSKMSGNWDSGSNTEMNESFIDGIYKFQLQNAEVVESEASGDLMVHVEHYCNEGELAGEVFHQYFNLEKPSEKDGEYWGRTFCCQWIEKMGYVIPDSPDQIEETVAEIAEKAPVYTAKIKENKEGYKQFEVKRLLDEEGVEIPTSGDSSGGSSGDDGFNVGDRVLVDFDGKDFGGEVTDVDEDNDVYTVTFDDGDVNEINGADLKEEEGGSEPVEPEPVDAFMNELIDFCQSQDIKVNDDDDEESLKGKINEFEWETVKLMENEIELLRGIDADIVEPEKKPAAKKKSVAKKPAARKTAAKKTSNKKSAKKKTTRKARR